MKYVKTFENFISTDQYRVPFNKTDLEIEVRDYICISDEFGDTAKLGVLIEKYNEHDDTEVFKKLKLKRIEDVKDITDVKIFLKNLNQLIYGEILPDGHDYAPRN